MGKLQFHAVGVAKHLQSARDYIDSMRGKLPTPVLDLCKNEHESCTIWAMQGECDANPTYMKKSCAPVCHSCEQLSIETRCPIDPEAPHAWKNPGDLDRMFRKLSTEPYLSRHSVQVLSSPETNGPWVITMENVVTEEEAIRLIDLGAAEGYERSKDVGPLKPDGTFEEDENAGRTSSNAWCQHECYADGTAKTVIERISNFTGIAEMHSEYLQLLQYEPGQFYNIHHDYIPHEKNRCVWSRLCAVYVESSILWEWTIMCGRIHSILNCTSPFSSFHI
jgi:prolyl 4-hydroxylase